MSYICTYDTYRVRQFSKIHDVHVLFSIWPNYDKNRAFFKNYFPIFLLCILPG